MKYLTIIAYTILSCNFNFILSFKLSPTIWSRYFSSLKSSLLPRSEESLRPMDPAFVYLDDKIHVGSPSNDELMVDVDPSTQIDLLYDSECPICQMEVDFLRKRDIHNRIRFTDLSSPDYNPALHGNVSFSAGMRKIRAVLPDNTVVVGVEVFRRTYEAIGLGWIFEITKLPVVGDIADKIYDIWAENRLRITGRGDLADTLKQRSEELAAQEPVDCDDSCGIDWGDDDED